MNICRLSIVLALVFFLPSPFLWAIPLSDLAQMADSDFPLKDTVRKDDENYELTLLPEVPGAEELQARFIEYAPELLIQKLYRIPLVNPVSNEALFVAVVNILGTPETQKGYTYHSSTRDKKIVLFKESYISSEKGKRLSGFSYDTQSVPPRIDYYQYVNEANFSGTVMKQTIRIARDHLIFNSTNVERIWYMVIPILKNEGTRSDMLFFQTGSSLYVYSSTQVLEDPSTRLAFSPHLPSLFGKRMDVMAQWLEDQLRRVIQ